MSTTDDTNATRRGSESSAELGPLVACPLCGRTNGYSLHDGTSYRWWRVCCGHCGADVAECRGDGGTSLNKPKPDRCPAADHQWNEAGKHAQSLREALRRVKCEAASLFEAQVIALEALRLT